MDVVLADGTKTKAKTVEQYVDLCNVLLDSRVERLVVPGYVPKASPGPGRGTTGPKCVVNKPAKARVLSVIVETRVPKGCVPGDSFHIRTAHGRIKVVVPTGRNPGDKLRLSVKPVSKDRFKLKRPAT
tara:strand:+ start:3867 stop:4250 length:384 start_codon:yes stop_codon:yes gene_type:complete